MREPCSSESNQFFEIPNPEEADVWSSSPQRIVSLQLKRIKFSISRQQNRKYPPTWGDYPMKNYIFTKEWHGCISLKYIGYVIRKVLKLKASL